MWFYNSFKNVKDYGATGDGNTCDRSAIQSVLDLGGNILIPSGYYLLSENQELSRHGLIIKSNTNLIIEGTVINENVTGAVIQSLGWAGDMDALSENINIIFNGGKILIRNTGNDTQKRSGLSFYSVSKCNIINYYGYSDGDQTNAYHFNLRFCKNINIQNPQIYVGNGIGEDGIHIEKGCEYIYLENAFVKSGDDALAITSQGSTGANKTVSNIYVNNFSGISQAHQGLKIYTDDAAANTVVHDVFINNSSFKTNTGDGGSVFSITNKGYQNNTKIKDIYFNNVLFNCLDSDYRIGTITNSDNINFNNSHFKGEKTQGLFVEGSSINISNSTISFNPELNHNINSFVINKAERISSDYYAKIRYYLDSNSDLSNVETDGTSILNVSGFANSENNGNKVIFAKDDINKTIDVWSNQERISAQDEINATATGILNKNRSGSGITFNNSHNCIISNNRFIKSPTQSTLLINNESEQIFIENNLFQGCVNIWNLRVTTDNNIMNNNKFVNCDTQYTVAESSGLQNNFIKNNNSYKINGKYRTYSNNVEENT